MTQLAERNIEIEAFLLMQDGSSYSNEEALEWLQNLGTFETQVCEDDLWDEEGDFGEEFANVTYGHMAELSLVHIENYEV